MNIALNIELAAKAIRKADALLICSGAGMGVDSGLPDFRGNEGFWKAYPPIAKLGLSFSEMANPIWFFNQPKLAWAFYGHRLNLYRNTIPHSGYTQLLEMGKRMKHGYFVYTSNVDGQFQKAGYDEQRIKECHGSIHHLQCTKPCCNSIWSASEIDIQIDESIFETSSPLPYCPNCGALTRPNILMFGDWHWLANRVDEQNENFSNWLSQIESGKLAIIETGAGKAVPSVRNKSEFIAKKMESTLIRINTRDFDVPHGNISINTGAKDGINQIFLKIQD